MKRTNQSENYTVKFRKETFELLEESARRTGKGFHRIIKDFLQINVFPFMTYGDSIYIKRVMINTNSVEVTMHLNPRLLVKAQELESRAV